MALKFEIDVETRLVTIRGDDPVSESSGILQKILEDPRFQRGFNFLRDRRQLTEPLDTRTVQAVVTYLRANVAQISPCRWAVVVPQERAVFYGVARMASAMMDESGIDFQVFRNYDAAVAWAVGKGGLED